MSSGAHGIYAPSDCDHNWFSHPFQRSDRIGNREQVLMLELKTEEKKCAVRNVPHERLIRQLGVITAI